MKNKLLVLIAMLILVSANAFGQAGGTFTIPESVVAGGGGQNAAGGTFSVDGTVGQTAAGNAISGAPFAVTSGFWNFTLAPSAATASISGRILATDGYGIRNVIISLTNASGGEVRLVRSSSFGYYKFEEVTVGESYILTVRSKRFVFEPDTRIITLLDELTDADFTALPLQ